MGSSNRCKIIAITLCLLATSAFIYRPSPPRVSGKPMPLHALMATISDWELTGSTPLQKEIISSLALDDYVYDTFAKDGNSVSLYVGYYFTKAKVGAAHSPLVCFPGQGWILSEKEEHILSVHGNNISYATMVATRGETRELILYWFQAFDRTSPGTFSQKINSILAQIMHKGEDNAFVRLSIPLSDLSPAAAILIGNEFITSFYPVFMQYITSQASADGLPPIS